MTPLDVLRSARAQIEKPERWTQDALGRDSDGIPVSGSLLATCLCAAGALRIVDAPAATKMQAWTILEDVIGLDLAFFNDLPCTTHSHVLAAFNKAIAVAEAS